MRDNLQDEQTRVFNEQVHDFWHAAFSRTIVEKQKYVILLFAINRAISPRSGLNPENVWREKISIAGPARLFVDYISPMTGWRGGWVRKRVNEVYVNNEGEEMNTSGRVLGPGSPLLMAGATPVEGTIRK